MCGLTGIITVKQQRAETLSSVDVVSLNEKINKINEQCSRTGSQCLESVDIKALGDAVKGLKRDSLFFQIFTDEKMQAELSKLAEELSGIIHKGTKLLSEQMGHLKSDEVDTISDHLEALKDIEWCMSREILENIKKIKNLYTGDLYSPVTIYKKINAVLNSIDRLEVRGRDSAGISLIFILKSADFERFGKSLEALNLLDQMEDRSKGDVLLNRCITLHEIPDKNGDIQKGISLTYKVAAEIGRLGDNINFLRNQIKNDQILQVLATFPNQYHTVLSHTRWASVGAISEPNCHPVDNKVIEILKKDFDAQSSIPNSQFLIPNSQFPIIHVCLNGDIDNYLELKEKFEAEGIQIPHDITTDTKIIPLQIEKYIKKGVPAAEAFRLAMNDFKGSHAIAMHTNLDPGKIFLAQRGSGQAIFVGLAEDHYMAASEVYGFVEETPYYLKMNGEKSIKDKNGKEIKGQIFILDQESAGGLEGIKALFYDGTPLDLKKEDIKATHITSRDIDRQGFPHYFLKEISEAPSSVEKTIQNRWKIEHNRRVISLDEKTVPKSLRDALIQDKIRRIFFVGQGTAGIAAQACADILTYYMADPSLMITSLKASEMSGFRLGDTRVGVGSSRVGVGSSLRLEPTTAMNDTLVVAITQSGTTADTNRTIDMVKERGAHTLAIVNRRDSDITFKVNGVMYTSSGRDIEMSVASTKAFYSQIVAGAVLGLFIARLKSRRNDEFVSHEIEELLQLPSYMRKILSMKEKIEKSAKKIATTKVYWAAVGSGPNKTSADETRIKLSELCYKTVSSDFVEDKKHIDLSAEPLIIVCTAGTRETVMGDIIKDTAIFRAHKALPVIIASEGEERFTSYADPDNIFHVPLVSEHFAPIVNTLVGHLWGYYAALAINDGSRFLYDFRQEIQAQIDEYAEKGLDVYELILEGNFREKIARFYNQFRIKKAENRLPSSMGFVASSDLTLLLKYLSGRLPVSDFELDFNIKGTALNMLNKLFECLGKSINGMARPVDAIKHQAKTVTVGTSRLSEKIEGILFEALESQGFRISQLINRNVMVLKNLQGIVSDIPGSTLYRIKGLNLLGEPTDESTIEMIKRTGTSLNISSRAEKDKRLQGTKNIIVRQGNIYVGKGRKDDRSILVIPIISDSPSTPNMIEYLLLLNIAFKADVTLPAKIKALGGKYEHIKNIVMENNIVWNDNLLDNIEIHELFGKSAEKIGEFIVSQR